MKAESPINGPDPTLRQESDVAYDRRLFHQQAPDNNESLESERERFWAELAAPLPYEDPSSGSLYNIHCFNRDRFRADQNLMAFFHAFGSSPTTRQGEEILSQISRRFPDNFIVAIGCEGSPDARPTKKWKRSADLQTMAYARQNCIETAKDNFGLDPQIRLDVIGQSLGGLLAYQIAKEAHSCDQQGQPPYIERLVLMSAPTKRKRAASFTSQTIAQELTGLKRDALSDLSRHALELAPGSIRHPGIYKKLLSLIESSRLDFSQLDTATDIYICAGENDGIARPDADACSLPNIRTYETTGDRHSDLLLDAGFCGRFLEDVLRRRD